MTTKTTDRVNGFKQRPDVSRRHLPELGVASACGDGRVNPAELPTIPRERREGAELPPGVTT